MAVKMDKQKQDSVGNERPAAGLLARLVVLSGVAIGGLLAVVILPAWLPGLAGSLLGPEPKAYWYLARSTAWVAYGMMWSSAMFGMLLTSRSARLWPGGPLAYNLHEYTSWLGLGFALFHALILIGDQYLAYSLGQILIPFTSLQYRPVWVGFGQIALYLTGVITASFYVKKRIGQRALRLIHTTSFLMYLLALFHGLGSGSDTQTWWGAGVYWVTGSSLMLLLIYRILVTSKNKIVNRGKLAME